MICAYFWVINREVPIYDHTDITPAPLTNSVLCFVEDPLCPKGSEYRRNTSSCPATCLEVFADISLPCPFTDQPGCECTPGHYLSIDQCVRKGQCGCVYDENRYAKVGSFVILESIH